VLLAAMDAMLQALGGARGEALPLSAADPEKW
jgi:hypothetical protein